MTDKEKEDLIIRTISANTTFTDDQMKAFEFGVHLAMNFHDDYAEWYEAYMRAVCATAAENKVFK